MYPIFFIVIWTIRNDLIEFLVDLSKCQYHPKSECFYFSNDTMYRKEKYIGNSVQKNRINKIVKETVTLMELSVSNYIFLTILKRHIK